MCLTIVVIGQSETVPGPGEDAMCERVE